MARVRKHLDPILDRLGAALARGGVGANAVTITGLALGLVAAVLIAGQYYLAAAIVIVVSRLCDGLDGAVARATRKTDFGGFLDIVLDFAFYGAIPLGFIVRRSAGQRSCRRSAALLVLRQRIEFSRLCHYGRKASDDDGCAGAKSLYFTTGLAEATETIAAFLAFCLFPTWFPLLAALFAVVCLYTALSRIVLARTRFRDVE